MKRAKQILALLMALALPLEMGGLAEEAAAQAAPAEAPAQEIEAGEPELAVAQDVAPEAQANLPAEAKSEYEAAPLAAEDDEDEDEEEPLINYPTKLTMSVGESCKQKISAAADKKFTYSSSNSAVVSVNSKGQLTAKKIGSATITVKGKNTQRSVKCKVTVKAAPTKLTLNKTSGKLEIDDTRTLTATISPSSAPKGVSWKSSNTRVATVEDGEITAVGEGTATITCTANKKTEKGKTVSASYKLTVYDPAKPSSFELNINTTKPRKLNLDDTLTLEYTMEPEDTVDSEVRWKSSNEKVATVEDGEVTPLREGTTVITATTTSVGQDGKKLSDKVTIQVVDPAKPSGIKIDVPNKKPLICYVDDDPLVLEYTLTSGTKTEAESDVIWTSSNKKIAAVSEDGEVEAKKAGTVTITATTVKKGTRGKKLSDSVKLVVIDPYKPVSVELDVKGTVELPKGETLQLEPTILPETAEDADLKWISSKPKIAKVSQDGEVTARKLGTAKITVKTKNGKKASVTIKVVP